MTARRGAPLRPSMRALTFAAVFVVILTTLAVAYAALVASQDRRDANRRVQRESNNIQLYADARAGALTETSYTATYVVLRQASSRERVIESMAQVDYAFVQLAANTPASDTSARERIGELRTDHLRAAQDYQTLFRMIDAGDTAGILAVAVDGGVAARAEQLTIDLRAAVDEARVRLASAQRDATAAAARSDQIVMVFLAAWALVLVASGAAILFWVVRPLERVRQASRDIAAGSIETRAPVAGPSETADLAADVNAMADKLLAHARELERANAQLGLALDAEREHARRDPLTNTLNHGAIASELRELIARGMRDGSQGAVVMVDVDGMKAVNDTFGHQVGDEVLRTVALALAHESAVVGRYGGDEFVVMLPAAGREEAERYRDGVARELAAAALRDPETGAAVPVVASFGVAVYPTEAARIDDLIKLADGAMYEAKRQRPLAASALGSQRLLAGDRAARIVGELVPLLAHGGSLDDKLGLVAHHLSVGAGYDAVNFDVFDEGTANVRDENVTLGTNVFLDAPKEDLDRWRQEQRTVFNHPVADILERTQRPVIMDDLAHDERLTAAQRELLVAVGIQSGIAVPLLWQGELIGIMSVGSKAGAAFGPRDAQFLMEVAVHVSAIIRMERLVAHLQMATARLAGARDDTVIMLAASVEAHDETTGTHLQRVRLLTDALAREMGYSLGDAERLSVAAVLHDVGKIRVPDAILAGSARLTEHEWLVMKQHTVWGAEFLAERPGFELASAIARAHHERWDGSGYPYSLAADEIPETATVVAVADAFDAMTSDRPYRRSRPAAAAVREIVRCSGTQFNPAVVAALMRLYRRRELPGYEQADGPEARAA